MTPPSQGSDTSTTQPKTSFASHISPMFQQYRAQMMWRFDLTNYEAVKGNAELILGRISSADMPPPPFSPLDQSQINLFMEWMNEGCPP